MRGLLRHGIGVRAIFVNKGKVGVPLLLAAKAKNDGFDGASDVVESFKDGERFGGGVFLNKWILAQYTCSLGSD